MKRFENLFVAIYVLSLPLAVLAAARFPRCGVVLVGLLAMAPAIMCGRAMWRIAPRTVRRMVWIFAAMVPLMLLPAFRFLAWTPLLLFWIFLYLMRSEEARDYAAWWKTQTFAHVPSPPDAIHDALGRDKQWHVYANAFSLRDGRTIPFLYWSGLGSTSVMLNAPAGSSHQTRMLHGLLGFSFSVQDTGEDFVRAVEALDPHFTARTTDGHFAVVWMDAKAGPVVQARMQTLRELLEKAK